MNPAVKKKALSAERSRVVREQVEEFPDYANNDKASSPHAFGGQFQPTTKFKTVPLPSIFNDRKVRTAGVRLQPIFSRQSKEDGHRQTKSLPAPLLATRSPSQASFDRFQAKEETRLLHQQQHRHQAPTEALPFYVLRGKKATSFSKQEMQEEELVKLQRLNLQPAPELYYGKGFGEEHKPVRARSLKQMRSPPKLDNASPDDSLGSLPQEPSNSSDLPPSSSPPSKPMTPVLIDRDYDAEAEKEAMKCRPDVEDPIPEEERDGDESTPPNENEPLAQEEGPLDENNPLSEQNTHSPPPSITTSDALQTSEDSPPPQQHEES